MNRFPAKLLKKLEDKTSQENFRSLGISKNCIDLSSNDYLGFASSEKIHLRAQQLLLNSTLKNGATGSRLLSGNHDLYSITEERIQDFHKAEAALIYNSGYDANVGFFSTVPQRGDVVFYDELIHASIRDGISMSHAKAYKFRHNDLEDLRNKLSRQWNSEALNEIFIVTESVFSMDGDSPDLKGMARLATENDCYLVVDEAHALGLFGKKGEGLVQELGLQEQVFARIVTFGKALGVHGAAILGGKELRDYLVNFSRSLIYTTALPPHSVASIYAAYEELEAAASRDDQTEQQQNSEVSVTNRLRRNINFFQEEVKKRGLGACFLQSNSAIQVCILPGNERVRSISRELEKEGFDVKPILSPTVQKGKERLRFCLHSFNSEQEISEVLELLAKLI